MFNFAKMLQCLAVRETNLETPLWQLTAEYKFLTVTAGHWAWGSEKQTMELQGKVGEGSILLVHDYLSVGHQGVRNPSVE